MNKVSTTTLGCKVNYADAQAILALLPEGLRPGVSIVATCCVTAEGEKQSRKEVRRASRRAGAGGIVYATGCAARLDPDGFAALAENVRVMTGEPARIASGIVDEMQGEAPVGEDETLAGEQSGSLACARTRFFLKVQDGCANMCSYCVVPRVRGMPRSIAAGEIIGLACEQVGCGVTELVVSGINVGAYDDGGMRLPDLLRELAGIEGLRRLRLSSIEAMDLTPQLLAVMGHSERIARHLHVPLQSGDDRVLAAMRRRYRYDDFAARVAAARKAIAGVNLTTDVMAGFPGEDEEAFEATLQAVQELGFTRMHVFNFSPRPGTRAAAMEPAVSPGERKSRSAALLELSRRLQEDHQQRKLGRLSEVLLESRADDGVARGYSSDYTRFAVPDGIPGMLTRVKAVGIVTDAVLGEVIDAG